MCCRSPPINHLPTLFSQLAFIVLKGIKIVICVADHPLVQYFQLALIVLKGIRRVICVADHPQ